MKIWILFLLFAVSIGLSAVGFSFGPEFGYEFGDATYTYDYDWDDDYDYDYDDTWDDSFESSSWRLSFVIDSNISKYNLINYRARVGYGQLDRTYDSTDWDQTYNVISTEHSIGFGIVRKDNLRMWIGPSFELDFMFYEDEHDYDTYSIEEDSFLFGFGFGPTFGVNIVPTQRFALAMEVGVKVGFQFGYIDYYYEDHDGYYDDDLYADIESTSFMLTFKAFPMLLAGEF